MFYLIDKPHGITSFGAINKLKYFLQNQENGKKKIKIGHSGTLDPFATGLILVATGTDTKKLNELIGLDKTYIATIDFSQDSDTRDLQYRDWIIKYELIPTFESDIHSKSSFKEKKFDGIIKDDQKILAPSLLQIQKKLTSLIPSGILPIPFFSAKKKNGKKLYDLAREGKNIQEFKEMKIHNYKIIKYQFPLLELEIHVGSGTYIRSIAHRLGKQFNLGGILITLRRTKIGNYELKNYSFKEIEGSNIKYCEIEKTI